MDTELNAETATYIVANIGALNWGLTETADINLVTELLGTGNAGIVYIAIGIAGLVALTERFEFTEIFAE